MLNRIRAIVLAALCACFAYGSSFAVEGGGVMELGKIGAETMLWKNPYITDGLVAWWDGIWNAVLGVHDSNATTYWNDLKRYSNATGIVDSVTALGPSVSSGSSVNCRHLEFASPIPRNATSWTMEFCFATEAHTGYWVLVASKEINGARYQVNVEDNLRFHFITPTVYTLNSGITSDEEKTGTLAVSWDGSVVKLYWNGALKDQTEMSAIQWYNTLRTDVTSFFSRYRTSVSDYIEPFWGTFHGARYFNRALSPDEISYNYSIDKLRFNLT